MKKLSILMLVVMLVGALLTACQPAPATPEKIVETVIVEKPGETIIQVVTPTPEPKQKKLEIFHWWTAPGEREAADAMFAAFKEKYPDIEIVENPVPGGGGVSHRVVLQSRIIAGIPPDTFQTLGGAELKNYVDSGALQPLDDLWQELNYASVIPGPLAKAVTVDGHPYVVPLNMHIQNILYYNMKLFEELGLSAPTKFDELLAACQAIQSAKPDMVCLGLGSKEKWGDAFVFDSILLEEGGPEYYVKLFKGEIDVANDPVFRAALEKFQQLIPYINSDHSGLTWDQSVALVGSGKAAMVIMGTWAIGAFVKGSNWQPGVDFGAVTFPQVPERILLFHPDCYGLATNAPDPEETLNWLRVVASPELQIPTDVTQGGLFARTDIAPTEFPDPIRQELQTYVSQNPGKLILDQHGSILPATAQPIYWDIISAFLAQPDVEKAITDTANMMTTYGVKEASAWYQWP
ncbi:MAG: ABC transporter substrate-binding protein [Anaerolineales bacterium]